jgi:hypothetical protein
MDLLSKVGYNSFYMDMVNKRNRVNLETVVLQSAFFVTNVSLVDKLEVANKVKKGLDILDGEPTILPVPNDAPLEIPRIILTSRNKAFSCHISSERIDLVINKSKIIESSIDLEKEILEKSDILSKLIHKSLNWSVHRVALIGQSRYKPEAGVLSFMKDLLSEQFAVDSAELEIHKLKHIKVGNFKSNQWIRLLSQNSGTPNEFISILYDINTLKTEKYSFVEGGSRTFFSPALTVIKDTLKEIL